MIAADTSSLVAFFNGEPGADTDRIASAFGLTELVLPPVVVTELLSDPLSSPALSERLGHVPILDIHEGHWVRAGHARRLVLLRGYKAKLGDALIAQSCIDHNVALITRDRDFRHFVEACGLKLA
jgi:predicted nucleic acid-binding protein